MTDLRSLIFSLGKVNWSGQSGHCYLWWLLWSHALLPANDKTGTTYDLLSIFWEPWPQKEDCYVKFQTKKRVTLPILCHMQFKTHFQVKFKPHHSNCRVFKRLWKWFKTIITLKGCEGIISLLMTSNNICPANRSLDYIAAHIPSESSPHCPPSLASR